MAQSLVTPPRSSPPRSYEALRERVRETLEGGRARAQKILQRIQSEMFWQSGRWIHLYLKYEKRTRGRAPYGEKVVADLARDLSYDKTFLYDALRVYRNYPIFRALGKLSVTHHRALLSVKDEERRKTLAAQAEQNGWSSHELLRRIRGSRSLTDRTRSGAVLAPLRGKLHYYRIVERGGWPVPAQSGSAKLGRKGRLFVDLGFRDFRELEVSPRKGAPVFQNGDIVEGTSLQKLSKKPGATQADLYTYRAEVLELPDADTFWLFIDKGFASYREDKIRLRGIDCPEISTPEGRRAKEFVEDLLRDDASPSGYRSVLITTTKTPDKWDRYLVDVYFEKDGQEIYLNRLLLEKGFAVPYQEASIHGGEKTESG